jgi:hypothetical protein
MIKTRDANPLWSQSWRKIFKGGTKGYFMKIIYYESKNQRKNFQSPALNHSEGWRHGLKAGDLASLIKTPKTSN